jgi:parallel beta-helix repeat protein
LRLVSRGASFATLGTRDGSLRISGAPSAKLLVRSWQAETHAPDLRLDDGRAAVSVWGDGRLDAVDARFEDLGFFHGRLSGVALTSPVGGAHPTGRLTRSDFVHNYFGAYSYEARNVAWIGNRFLDNVVYGLDPHDDSDGFLVQGNLASGNGRHGIIFSRLCDHNVIRDNVSEHNGWHGIVLDDGKTGDGPSNGNRVVGNVVRDNGKVGISLDGSGANQIYANRIEGQPIGIRLFGRSLGNTVSRNRVTGASVLGILVDSPSASNAILGNQVVGATTGLRIRGASETIVRANALLGARGHAVSIDGGAQVRGDGIVLEDNTLTGRGASPVLVRHTPRLERRRNRVRWDYPTGHDASRVLGWLVGPGVWLLILGGAALGPAALGVGGLAGRARAASGLVVLGGVAIAIAALVPGPGAPRAAGATRVALHPPTDRRLVATQQIDPAARPTALRILSKDGHPTHPTWYHDSQVVQAGRDLLIAWNARGEVRVARLGAQDLRILDKARLNGTRLGGSVDSTGTDTNRHDVPTVISDRRGGAHFLYGGGSAAARRPPGPPYVRDLRRSGDLTSLGAEAVPRVAGGPAFDFESAVDNTGVRHLIGQRGRGNTGALVEARMTREGRWLAPRQIINGGFSPTACVLDGRARGCNRFAIARIAADRRGGLHLTWGYSEASLGGKCRTDSGYCDNNLYYAASRDGGATWHDVTGRFSVRLGRGRAIAHDDSRFLVASGHIGLFKAIATDASGPLLVGTIVNGQRADLVAWRFVHGAWSSFVIARAGEAVVKTWAGSLVLRHDPRGFTLWTPTGDRIFRFSSPDGRRWQRGLVYRGSAWSLTGTRARAHGREVLLWRGTQHGDRSDVMVAVVPAAR